MLAVRGGAGEVAGGGAVAGGGEGTGVVAGGLGLDGQA
jgi:hypothetical protein